MSPTYIYPVRISLHIRCLKKRDWVGGVEGLLEQQNKIKNGKKLRHIYFGFHSVKDSVVFYNGAQGETGCTITILGNQPGWKLPNYSSVGPSLKGH